MAKVKTHRQAVGFWGENLAAQYLLGKGYQVLEKNVRTPYGEIDLIAHREGVLVFVEVKTRTNTNYGLPETAIGTQKRTHLIQSAEAYLQAHPEQTDAWQIDVIAIQRIPNSTEVEVLHFENAIC